MKKILLFLVLLPLWVFAKHVPVDKAQNVAINGFKELAEVKNPGVELYQTEQYHGNDVFYIFNLTKGKGFIIVSADDRIIPILGYSTVNDFGEYPVPDGLKDFLETYKLQIADVIENNLSGMEQAPSQWKHYSVPTEKFKPHKNDRFYLLGNINWDQGCGWNAYCPEDPNGDCGHVWTGCIATAAGMIMKYWGYPPHGRGQHSYQEDDYGTLSANFDTTYYWDNMQDNSATDPAALLLYHFGVAVEMDYSPNGSGALFGDELNALKTYFGYNPDLSFKAKSWFPNEEDWINMLKEQLDAGYPLPYKGSSNSSGGHAFVCDGYNSSNQFHFNWGWSGWYNGYYSINNLNPGGENFTENQAAGFDVHPEAPAPEHIHADINPDNTVLLTWTRPNALKEPSYYKIAKDGNWLDQTITDTFFVDNDPLDPGMHTYEVKAVYSGFYLFDGEIESEPTATSFIITNVKKLDKDFRITPNPASTYISIQSNRKDFTVEISDLNGKIYGTYHNPQTINIKSLPEGIYFIKITTDNQEICQKIIKL